MIQVKAGQHGGGVLRFAVIGRPVAHSLSPDIHTDFARQRNLSIDYQRIECADGEFNDVVTEFFHRGGAGLNVTTPFKEPAHALSTAHSAYASLAASVNTLRASTKEGLEGHNTDGLGLCRDLSCNMGLDLAQSSVLLLGAGATARSTVLALAAYRPRHITVFNRSEERLAGFIESCRESADDYLRARVPVGLWASCENQFDLIINCASSALRGEKAVLPQLTRQPAHCLAYDLSYGRGQTAFLEWAQDTLGCRSCDGIGMLVEQAAYSFAWWHGEPMPQTNTLISQLTRIHSHSPRPKR
ncbi:MAG: shikimate dehydrogenase [Proteobacteria bacterium]|nr:shikimate dehydrogenase [Pseudomonadota bacterium]